MTTITVHHTSWSTTHKPFVRYWRIILVELCHSAYCRQHSNVTDNNLYQVLAVDVFTWAWLAATYVGLDSNGTFVPATATSTADRCYLLLMDTSELLIKNSDKGLLPAGNNSSVGILCRTCCCRWTILRSHTVTGLH
jgi:hypothetical protein